METLDTITRGDNEGIEGQALQYAGGPARDITNDTLKFTIKRKETDATFILQKGTEAPLAGISKTNAAQGEYLIEIDKTDLTTLSKAALGPSAFVCDVELTTPAGKRYTLGKWRLPVDLDVTT